MMAATTRITNPEQTNIAAELAAGIESMDLKTINRFWDEQIKILDGKLACIHQEQKYRIRI